MQFEHELAEMHYTSDRIFGSIGGVQRGSNPLAGKKGVVYHLVVDYDLTTIDYYILPRFALFCDMCHILRILCTFRRVHKSLQSTAESVLLSEMPENQGIVGL